MNTSLRGDSRDESSSSAPSALISLIEAALSQGDAGLAESLAESLVKVFPTDKSAYLTLHSVYLKQEKLAHARKTIRAGLTLYPEDPSFRCCYAKILLEKNHATWARDLLTPILECEQENETLNSLLIRALLDLNDIRGAKRVADQWVLVAPQSSKAFLNLGIILSKDSKAESSIALKQIIQGILNKSVADPEDQILSIKLIEKTLGWSNALEQIKKYLQDDPRREDLFIRTAEILESKGDPSGACAILTNVLAGLASPKIRQAIESKFTPLPGTQSNTVVLVTDHWGPRQQRLVDIAWTVGKQVLVLCPFSRSNLFADVAKIEVQLYENSEHALYLIGQRSPRVVHILLELKDPSLSVLMDSKRWTSIVEIPQYYEQPDSRERSIQALDDIIIRKATYFVKETDASRCFGRFAKTINPRIRLLDETDLQQKYSD